MKAKCSNTHKAFYWFHVNTYITETDFFSSKLVEMFPIYRNRLSLDSENSQHTVFLLSPHWFIK